MISLIPNKPAFVATSLNAAHPFEAGVRKDIAVLRGQLTSLRSAGALDPFAKSQVKNLEAQLGKKNAYLATLAPIAEKPEPAPEAKKVQAEPKLPPAARSARATNAKPAAPEQSFGALGARLKGSLAPALLAKLPLGPVPEVEGF